MKQAFISPFDACIPYTSNCVTVCVCVCARIRSSKCNDYHEISMDLTIVSSINGNIRAQKQKPIQNGHRFSIQLLFCVTIFFLSFYFIRRVHSFVRASDFRVVQRADQMYSVLFKVSVFFFFVRFFFGTESKIKFRLVEPSKLAAVKVNQGSHHTSVVIYTLTSVS